ncbi:MAG: hypothetical protein HUJ56_01845 [Erysipelotrichaceae bacterium]|nr:hypothetical protein [Erysipelotrichaceae bacterium]
MIPFDLELAKKGYPICTKDGKKARVICWDRNYDGYPLLVLITETNGMEFSYPYTKDGLPCNTLENRQPEYILVMEELEDDFEEVIRYQRVQRWGGYDSVISTLYNTPHEAMEAEHSCGYIEVKVKMKKDNVTHIKMKDLGMLNMKDVIYTNGSDR